MAFNKKALHKAAMEAVGILVFDEIWLDPSLPTGLWFCASPEEAKRIQINAVSLALLSSWDDVPKCKALFDLFPYVVIATPNALAREDMLEELRPRLPSTSLYVVTDAGWRKCKTVDEYIDAYGESQIPNILTGAEELPAYGLINLATVRSRDLSKVPRCLSTFPVLDRGIGGFFAGELSVWTGKRGIGKSTILGQLLLDAIDQGHTVCAYSGELTAAQFRDWIYLQAAGPNHIVYQEDSATGKKLARPDAMAEKLIDEWTNERFWLFDLEHNSQHDPEHILSQFEYAHMRYGADVFLVDNIMAVDFELSRTVDFNRAQSKFAIALARFCKKHNVHIHLVVHPRKATSDKNSAVTSDDVSGSGDITNAADNVFFLTTHAADGNDGITQKPLLQILKNRDFGAKGQQWLDFDRKSRRFFPDRGIPDKRYGWDPQARQISLLENPEDQAELAAVFPVNGGEAG